MTLRQAIRKYIIEEAFRNPILEGKKRKKKKKSSSNAVAPLDSPNHNPVEIKKAGIKSKKKKATSKKDVEDFLESIHRQVRRKVLKK